MPWGWAEARHPRHGRVDGLTQAQYDILADAPENAPAGTIKNGQAVMY